jgi:glucosamine 6-phosphate synthetase-like amidotransferase/phosphosugar isomerase protein
MLESQGCIFQSTSDTEILAHLLKTDRRRDRLAALEEALTMPVSLKWKERQR